MIFFRYLRLSHPRLKTSYLFVYKDMTTSQPTLPYPSILTIVALSLLLSRASLAQSIRMVDVFESGREGYTSFRIPALLTTQQGTLLAFAEGREISSDHAANDIVLKRSEDSGMTWGNLQVVTEDGDNSLNNPQVVQEQETGRIMLMYQRFPQGFHEREVVPGLTGDTICRSYILYSDDDGRSWSEPAEITASVKRPTFVTTVASGPGIGIQLQRGAHAGRIIMPFNQGPFTKWKVYAVYSDDRGESWEYGEVAFNDSPGTGNEVQMVELSDGSVMLNSRSYQGDQVRKVAVSSDGGANWSGLQDEPALVEPECQASLLRYSFPEDGEVSRIVFANPASKDRRADGTLRVSYDEGESWEVSRPLYKGPFAYSSLARLRNGDIGVLFEKDEYATITLAIVPLDYLEGGER